MLLTELQQLLSRLYRLDVDADINDFVVTDSELLQQVICETTPVASEVLLIRESIDESGDALDVALYIDAEMLDRLGSADPRTCLHEQNLNDFCTVLEGVSHFVYLFWNAIRNKQITQLELELQAEIDKYMSTRLLLEAQSNAELSSNIVAALFESVAFRDGLSAERLDRYQRANDFAGRYCYSLQQRFPPNETSATMVDELRSLYRMPQRDKLSHMQSVQFA
jgi:hypothetical protein